MRAGAAQVDISPPLPVDVLGYVRRAVAPRRFAEPLLVTALVVSDGPTTVAILAADLVGMTTPFADRVRDAVAAAIGCARGDVLINSSHSHAAPWPGAIIKLGGEADEWTDIELGYWDTLPNAFASAAVQAQAALCEARISDAVGHAPGIAVNRRERTADGRTILGWNREGFFDDSVPTLRIDDLDGRAIATVVGFGCHPVVVGPEVAAAGPDFVGPLRTRTTQLRGGGVTVFLQGAAGNVLPLEAFIDRQGPEVSFGERLALEAAHAVADAEPRAMTIDHTAYGSVTPISLYRRRVADDQPAQGASRVRRIVDLPLLQAPDRTVLEAELAERVADLARRAEAGETRATMNPVRYHISWIEHVLSLADEGLLPTSVPGEVWAARIGDCAVVGTPGEIFGEIGAAVRDASPAATTIFAGYCNGVLGYVATPEEHPYGGYEPAVSHRGYGQPAPFAPAAADILRETSLALLARLFPTPLSRGDA